MTRLGMTWKRHCRMSSFFPHEGPVHSPERLGYYEVQAQMPQYGKYHRKVEMIMITHRQIRRHHFFQIMAARQAATGRDPGTC